MPNRRRSRLRVRRRLFPLPLGIRFPGGLRDAGHGSVRHVGGGAHLEVTGGVDAGGFDIPGTFWLETIHRKGRTP